MKIKRLIQKDRYGIIRGAIALSAILLICSLVFAQVLKKNDSKAQLERAGSAVLQVSMQFEQTMQAGANYLEASADLIAVEDIQPVQLLHHVTGFDLFSDAALFKDGVLLRNGSSSVPDQAMGTELRESKSNILVHEQEIILFTPLNDGSMLLGWIDPDRLHDMFSAVFDAEYGYAVYNVETGAFMINKTGFECGGYYDALLGINENGDLGVLLSTENAQAFFSGKGELAGKYCIAQRNTQLQPWGVSLVIPEALLSGSGWNTAFWQYYVLCAGILMMIILISYSMFAVRKIRVSNRNAARALEAGERMMGIVAQDAGVTLVEYHRNQNGMIACYDGLGLMGEKTTEPVIRTLSGLEESCEMGASQAEMLHEKLRELKPGESAELSLRCGVHNHQERVLQFALYASAEQENGIVCCIRDGTQEQAFMDRAELEENYQKAVSAKASSIWQVNISRNRWRALQSRKNSILYSIDVASGEWRDYSLDLSGKLREYMYPADYEAYADVMSIVSIASMFRSGKTEFSQDYRVGGVGGNPYKWHRMRVRIWLHPESGDIIANLYVFNVDAEKKAEMERGERKQILHKALTAMGGIYSGLYYVDLDQNLSYTARAMDGELVTSLCVPFKETFERYIQQKVHPEDQADLSHMLSAYNLRRNMTEGTHFQRRKYRRRIDDHYDWTLAIVQPARFENGSVKEVVVAFRYLKTEDEAIEN